MKFPSFICHHFRIIPFFSVFDAPSSPKKGPNPGMVCEIRRESFRRLLEELGKVRLGEFEDLGFGPAGFRV